MKGLNVYPITEALMNNLNGIYSLFIDAHDANDANDQEGSDIVWIRKYADGGMSGGEYLAISPSSPTPVEWRVAHKAADISGGHPTYWSKSGPIEALLPVITDYFINRANELK
jgi:hypothetical protein